MLLDANVLIRFITKDVPDKAERARALLKRGEVGEVRLILNAMVVAEVVYILRAHYKFTYEDIETILLQLIGSNAVETLERSVVERALMMVTRHNVDFEDAYFDVLADVQGWQVASFDETARKRLGARWIEP
jgi:predicted nucleic acid-binding protein